MKRISDYLFLIVTGVLAIKLLVDHFLTGFEMAATNYAAVVFWMAIVVLFIIKKNIGKYGIAVLLLLGSVNLLNYFPWIVWFKFAIGDTTLTAFNPVMMCLLVVYYIIHRRQINGRLKILLKATDEDRKIGYQQKVDGYLKTFGSLTTPELAAVIKNINDYPPEAQSALKMLNERDKTFDNI